MTDATEETVLEGVPPSEEDQFYISWGRETLKSNLAFANEVLRQLTTLNSTLLGGSILFLDEKIINPTFKTPILVLFFLSLVVSFMGMMPYEGSVDLRQPSEIRCHKKNALRWKRCFLWVAGAMLALGFVVALVAMIARSVPSG